MGSGDFSGALAAQGTSALFPYLVYAVPVLLLLYNFFGPGNVSTDMSCYPLAL